MKILFNIQTKKIHFFIRMAMNQRSRLVVGIEVFAEVFADTAVVAEAVLDIEAVDTAVSALSLLVSKRSMM